MLHAASTVGVDALRDVHLERPLVVAGDGPVAVQVSVDPCVGGTVAVHADGPTGWRRIADARLAPADDEPGPAPDGTVVDVASETAVGATLEACFAAAVADAANRALTVVGAGAIRRIGAPTAHMTCRVLVREVDEPARSRRADVVLLDGRGAPVTMARDVLLQPWVDASSEPDDWCLGVAWPAAPRLEPPADAGGTRWLVLADGSGYGAALAASLRTAGADVTLVTGAADVDHAAVLADLPPGPIGVAFLWGLDGPSGLPATVDELDRVQRAGCGALVDVVGALVASGRQAAIHAVTRGAQRVTPDDVADGAAQASIWGFGRAVAEEHPDLWGGLVDIDPADDPAAAAPRLLGELLSGPGEGEGEVAWRGGTRHVARLVPRPPGAAGIAIRPGTTCLVTGGFGAVGRPLAEWLAANGARRIVLLGRTPLPPRGEWPDVDPAGPAGRRIAFVRRLEGRGVAVHVAAVDVGDDDALRGFLADFAAEGWPPIRSVFHAAAVFGGELVTDIGPAALRAQLAPKVTGTWTLANALPDLDHLVLFSSIAATMPFPGQGAYAAANAFVEAYAEALAAAGRPVVSIGWPYWEGSDELLAGEVGQRRDDVGRGYKETARLLTEGVGMRGMRTEQGLDLLGRLTASGAARTVVVPVDWQSFVAARAARVPALVRDLVSSSSPAASSTPTDGPPTLAALLTAAPAEERADLAATAVRRLVGAIVKLPASRIEDRAPFGSLGFDSLLAIELRNRLEAELGLAFSATVAWNYPSVHDLSAHLLDRLAAAAPRSSGSAAVPSTGSDTPRSADQAERRTEAGTDRDGEVVSGVIALSEDEALAALLEGSGS